MSTIEEVVTITSVWEETVGRTRNIRKFHVSAKRFGQEEIDAYLTLSTLNELRATACKRAMELHRPARLTWAPGKYFDADLLNVELLETAA